MRRPRRPFVTLLLLTIALGLASRRFGGLLPAFVARYAGDTLWATMVFWWLVLLAPAARTMRLALAAMLISATVEASQLYRAPWLDALRSTRLGALVLGEGFLWSDLVCYAVGVLLAAIIDWRMDSSQRQTANSRDGQPYA